MVLLLASLGLGAPAALFDPGKKWIWSMYVFGGGTGGGGGKSFACPQQAAIGDP